MPKFSEIRKALAPRKNRKNPPVCVMASPETIRWHQNEVSPTMDNTPDLLLKRYRCKPLPLLVIQYMPFNFLVVMYENLRTRFFQITEKPPKQKKEKGHWEEWYVEDE